MQTKEKPDGVSTRPASEVSHVRELSREADAPRKLQIVADAAHDYTTGSKVDHALALARAGFRVFPLRPNAKTPAIPDWTHSATADPDTLRRWWTEHPDSNIGLLTTGRLVVDLDNKNGKRGSFEWDKLQFGGLDVPATRTHRTPTGGEHLLFDWPEGVANGVDVLGPGLDIRGKNGYVVGPGSTIGGVPYTVLDARPPVRAPDELVARCKRPKERPADMPTEPPALIDQGAAERRAIEMLEAEPGYTMGDSCDAKTLRLAMRVRDFGIPEPRCLDLMLEHWNDRTSPPWPPDKLQTKVRNAYRYASEGIGSRAPELDFEPVPVEETPPAATPAPKPRSRFAFRAFHEIEQAAEVPVLVDDLLTVGGFCVLYGPPNAGKSFAALSLAFAISRGVPWFGRRTTRAGAVYLNTDGGDKIDNRVIAYRRHHGLDGERLPFGLVSTDLDLHGSRKDADEVAEEVRAFSEQWGLPVGLIVIDTVAQSMGQGDESSTRDMGQFVRHCNQLRAATRAAIVAVHHPGKDGTKGARGSTALLGACDTELHVSDKRVISTTKQRDLPKGPPIGFDLVPVVVGTTTYGGDVTSMVAVSAQVSVADDFKPDRPKAGTQASEMLDALRSLVKRGPVEAGMHPGVLLMNWEAECLKRLDGKDRAFRAGRAKLLEGRCIEIEDVAGIVRLLA